MAKLVTSDGVQVNLFLDLDSHNTGEGTLLYGPKSQAEMDFIVKGFRNFKTNTEYNDKNRLEFHCTHLIQVTISALMSANPTSSSQYTVPGHSDTKLYFVGDDLILSKTGAKIHRIDLFKSASTNDVLTVNGASPDASGNVTVTVGNDHSTEISNLTTRVTTLENTGGGGGNNALYAPPQNLFLNTSLHDSYDINTSKIYNHTGGNALFTFTVPSFENFKTTHDDKYKLTFYTASGYSEVIISDLIAENPSSTNPFYLKYSEDYEDGLSISIYKLYFSGNHLVLKIDRQGIARNKRYDVYRIDMHLNAFGGGVTTVNGQTGDVTVSTFDGNYNSLSNKPTIPTDINQLDDDSQLLSSGGVTSVNGQAGDVSTGSPLSRHFFKKEIFIAAPWSINYPNFYIRDLFLISGWTNQMYSHNVSFKGKVKIHGIEFSYRYNACVLDSEFVLTPGGRPGGPYYPINQNNIQGPSHSINYSNKTLNTFGINETFEDSPPYEILDFSYNPVIEVPYGSYESNRLTIFVGQCECVVPNRSIHNQTLHSPETMKLNVEVEISSDSWDIYSSYGDWGGWDFTWLV